MSVLHFDELRTRNIILAALTSPAPVLIQAQRGSFSAANPFATMQQGMQQGMQQAQMSSTLYTRETQADGALALPLPRSGAPVSLASLQRCVARAICWMKSDVLETARAVS